MSWVTNKKGNPLEFDIFASSIWIMFKRTIIKGEAANIICEINGIPRKLDAFFKNGWEDYFQVMLLKQCDSPENIKIIFRYEDFEEKEFKTRILVSQ